MITKLLVDKLLKPDHFLRATEQAGPYIGQPVADTDNEGQMRLVSSGDENDEINNLSYTSGEATSNGTQTTLTDRKLCIFGESVLVGATMTLTSGVSSGESRKVTAFISSSGSLAWADAVAATTTGTSYSLELDYRNRTFEVELTEDGDTGEASFIWSHDGSQYFSREDPLTNHWKAGTTICTDFYSFYNSSALGPTTPYCFPVSFPIIQAENGNILALYIRDVSSNLLAETSSDNGLTWSTVDTGISPEGPYNGYRSVHDAIVLKSGRIIVTGGLIGIKVYGSLGQYGAFMYSDDNGETWTAQPAYAASDDTPPRLDRIIELNNGNLIATDGDGYLTLKVRVSSNGGSYWGNRITAHSGTSVMHIYDIIQMDNENVLCSYYTKELDPGTTYALRCCISEDNGATWGDVTTILTSNNHLIMPTLGKDLNGDIYCAFSEQVTGAGSSIGFVVSTDNAASWGASRLLASNENHTLHYPFLNTINGCELVCSYIDDIVGSTSAVFCRIGRAADYTDYPTSYITCAPDLTKHRLINDVAVQWYGGNGKDGDIWTFAPEYQHAAENIISDSPKKVWRSINDGVTCELIIDMGANVRFLADSVAFFDCNISSCSVEMNSSDSWSSPDISESVSFVENTGSINSVADNYLSDTGNSLFDNHYQDHELGDGKHYLTMTSGTSDGYTFLIADNMDNTVAIDTTEAHGISAADTFSLYGSKIYSVFNSGTTMYRYMRIYIPAQKTPQGYYQIGTAILGKTTTFDNTFSDNGYSRDSDYNIELMKSLSGSVNPIVYNNRKQKRSVTWDSSKTSRKQVQAAITYAKGNNMAFIPDWFVPSGGSKSSTTDVYLVKQSGTIRENFRYKDRWDLSVDFEENI